MKIKLYLVLIFVCSVSYGQDTFLTFEYDTAGNQTKRAIVIRATPLAGATSKVVTNPELIKDELYTDISYYPNPVCQELYVKWSIQNNNPVNNIEVYNLSGQLIKNYPNLTSLDNTNVNFESYPEGLYNLILVYNDGVSKVLKIVKK
jgi:hypothetical protein